MPYEKLKNENYSQLGGMNTKVSPYDTGPSEALNLINYDFTRPGALTGRPGSTLYIGTTVSGRVGGLYEFNRLSGFSQIIVTANTNAYFINGNNLTAFKTGLLNNALFDFVTFVDRLFYSNGDLFNKYDGANSYLYSLPPGDSSHFALGTTVVGSGLSGTYSTAYAYVNERGYIGPVSTVQKASLNGITFASLMFTGMTAPTGFGITAIALFRSSADSDQLFLAEVIPVPTPPFNPVLDGTVVLTSTPPVTYLYFTLTPKYLDIYNNQLMMAGFSAFPSVLWFSDIGEPEGVEPDFNFEVRTNDGDRITGFINYNGSEMVFKERSFHKISGDNPNNFVLQEVSDQYGCLSNRAIAIYENILLFLDRKGIVEYNGANFRISSTKIEPIFLSMNIEAAKENAVAIHHRLRNEVWFGIPINGATFNNCTVVYDYLSNAWSLFQGFNPSSLSVIKGHLVNPSAFYGSYSGSISHFDPFIGSSQSLFADNGSGITFVMKSRFLNDLGQSVEKQFRRFYLDVDPVAGVTGNINVNFYTDYGASLQLSRVMTQAPFQSRIDFGLPAKSLAAEVICVGSTSGIRINGFTIEHRFQRNV